MPPIAGTLLYTGELKNHDNGPTAETYPQLGRSKQCEISLTCPARLGNGFDVYLPQEVEVVLKGKPKHSH